MPFFRREVWWQNEARQKAGFEGQDSLGKAFKRRAKKSTLPKEGQFGPWGLRTELVQDIIFKIVWKDVTKIGILITLRPKFTWLKFEN